MSAREVHNSASSITTACVVRPPRSNKAFLAEEVAWSEQRHGDFLSSAVWRTIRTLRA